MLAPGGVEPRADGEPEVVDASLPRGTPRHLRILANTFERHTRVEVEPLDLGAFDPAALADRRLDTVVCINVLEHIENDRQTLRRLWESLVPGGRLVLLVPAHGWLHGAIDRAIHHWRRYERTDLVARLSPLPPRPRRSRPGRGA